MRLRRETGDFQIVLKAGKGEEITTSIRKGLGVEDLIGEVVTLETDEVNGMFTVVGARVADNHIVMLIPITGSGTTGSANLIAINYNPATGEVVLDD